MRLQSHGGVPPLMESKRVARTTEHHSLLHSTVNWRRAKPFMAHAVWKLT
jgi:hypothetical protein